MLFDYFWIYLWRKVRQLTSACVCCSVIVIRPLDCMNTHCGTAHTGNRGAVLHTDTHCTLTQFDAFELISQNSTYSYKVLQYARAFDYERCLSVRPRQKDVTTTTDSDTVLTNRPRTQGHNSIPIHPTVFTYIANTWKCGVGRHIFLCLQQHKFTVTWKFYLLHLPFTSVLEFSPLLYSIYLAHVQQTASGVPAMLPVHISLCVSTPFQLLN